MFLGVFKKILKVFLKVLVYKKDRTQNYDPGLQEHPMHNSPWHTFFVNYDKILKSRLEYEIKYDLYKNAQKIKISKT